MAPNLIRRLTVTSLRRGGVLHPVRGRHLRQDRHQVHDRRRPPQRCSSNLPPSFSRGSRALHCGYECKHLYVFELFSPRLFFLRFCFYESGLISRSRVVPRGFCALPLNLFPLVKSASFGSHGFEGENVLSQCRRDRSREGGGPGSRKRARNWQVSKTDVAGNVVVCSHLLEIWMTLALIFHISSTGH